MLSWHNMIWTTYKDNIYRCWLINMGVFIVWALAWMDMLYFLPFFQFCLISLSYFLWIIYYIILLYLYSNTIATSSTKLFSAGLQSDSVTQSDLLKTDFAISVPRVRVVIAALLCLLYLWLWVCVKPQFSLGITVLKPYFKAHFQYFFFPPFYMYVYCLCVS